MAQYQLRRLEIARSLNNIGLTKHSEQQHKGHGVLGDEEY